jgi:hypothetical protein
MSTEPEDLTEIEHAGRRCRVCGSGRAWRKFHVVRAEGSEPIVLCAACHARFGDAPPVKGEPAAAPEPVAVVAEAPAPPRAPAEPNKDRLKTAIEGLSGPFSTATAARAAGLNSEKTLARLKDLEQRGDIQRVGNRWLAEPPPTDITAAMDRLAARTSNLRIVRDRARA